MYGRKLSNQGTAASLLNGTDFWHSYASSAGTVGVAAVADATSAATLAQGSPEDPGGAVVVAGAEEDGAADTLVNTSHHLTKHSMNVILLAE